MILDGPNLTLIAAEANTFVSNYRNGRRNVISNIINQFSCNSCACCAQNVLNSTASYLEFHKNLRLYQSFDISPLNIFSLLFTILLELIGFYSAEASDLSPICFFLHLISCSISYDESRFQLIVLFFTQFHAGEW